ncbi:hypothetical protein CHUAL_000259 [Chamberlinius hualienensis]
MAAFTVTSGYSRLGKEHPDDDLIAASDCSCVHLELPVRGLRVRANHQTGVDCQFRYKHLYSFLMNVPSEGVR